MRGIVQYDVVRPDSEWTTLERTRCFNADVLVSYVLNPWTAFYAGYNGNARALGATFDRLRRDAQQFFVKLSYLYRF